MSSFRNCFRYLTSLTLCLCLTTVLEARGRVRRIEWPSSQYPTLQEAIDALPDGGVLVIASGTYRVAEPLEVTGKRVQIRGAGNGLDGSRNFTRLVGPPTRPIVDERGTMLVPASRSKGVFNLLASDAIISDMRLEGGDAAIVCRDDAEGNSGSAMAWGLAISDTGRGILSLSSESVAVVDCLITNCGWHGISVAPQPSPGISPGLVVVSTGISGLYGGGIYFKNTWAIVLGATVENGLQGGIIGYNSLATISDSTIRNNFVAGIKLESSQATPLIQRNLIENSWGVPNWGDGVILMLSDATLRSNEIRNCDRCGVSLFGGEATLQDNTIACTAFPLEYETYQGVQGTFNDTGGNSCGCPNPNGVCVASTVGLEPPEPVAPIE